MRQHLRPADPAGQLQREPVLAAVHGPRRRRCTSSSTTSTTRHRHRQPQPGAARQVDRRRADLQRPGQGRRLLRPARLRHLPGRRRRPGPRLRAGEGADLATRSSGRRTTRSGASTRRPRRRSWSPTARTSTATPRSRTAARPAGFAADGLNLYTGVKTAGALQQRDPAQRVDERRPSVHRRRSDADPRTQATVNGRRSRRAPTSAGSGRRSTSDGTLAVSYYDRQYGDDETTGYSDFSLSGVARPGALRREAGHELVDAAADPVLRASSSATTPASTRSTTPTRSGRTRAPPTCSSAPAPEPPGTRPTSASAWRAPARRWA